MGILLSLGQEMRESKKMSKKLSRWVLDIPRMMSQPDWKEKTDILADEDISAGAPSELIVYNDDFNTFDWVIACFQEILGHSSIQAEQLAMLIHLKGKATVKSGHLDELKPQKDALVDRGLSAVIEAV